MEKVAGIYKIINKIDGKIYIGSSNNIDRRWRQHTSALNNQRHENDYLQRSWDKHGKESFEFLIIEEVTVETLLIREDYWIQEFKSFDRMYGYNLIEKPSRKTHTEETKIKMSNSAKGRIVSDKCRKATAKSNKERIWTPEMRDKVRKTKKLQGFPKHGMEKARELNTKYPDELIFKIVKEHKEKGVSIRQLFLKYEIPYENYSHIFTKRFPGLLENKVTNTKYSKEFIEILNKEYKETGCSKISLLRKYNISPGNNHLFK